RPHVGVGVEVGVMILLAAWVIPKAEGHRRRRRLADQLALFVDDRLAFVVVRFDFHPERRALEFPRVDRQNWAPRGKTTVDVGATRDGIKMDIVFDFTIDIFETGNGKRRAGL